MSKMSYSEALGTAMKIRMREDPRVMLFGEDVGIMGGTYGVSQGHGGRIRHGSRARYANF